MLVGASLDQLLRVTLEVLAQDESLNSLYLRKFLQALLAVMNTVTDEHSIKNESSLYLTGSGEVS